jgi:hypothetical protein
MRWLAILLCFATSCLAADLEWDWSQGDGGAADGFRIHYGSQSGIYTESVDVGLVQQWHVPDAWPNGTYFFAATAYNSAGVSPYSNEAVYVRDIVSGIQPASGGRYQLSWIEDHLMTTFTEDFSSDPAGNWTNLYGTASYDSTNDEIDITADYYIYGTNLSGVNQYAKAKFTAGGNPYGGGLVLRSTGTAADGWYVLAKAFGTNTWYLSFCDNVGDGWAEDMVDNTSGPTLAAGDSVGVTITGTGTSTTVRVWKNPTNAAPVSAEYWDSGSDGPDFSLSLSGYAGSNFCNTGLRVGVGGWGTLSFDDVSGGDIPTGGGASAVPAIMRQYRARR